MPDRAGLRWWRNDCPHCQQPLLTPFHGPWVCTRCRVTLEDFAQQLARLRARACIERACNGWWPGPA